MNDDRIMLVADVLARLHFQKYSGSNQQMAGEGAEAWAKRSAVHFEGDAKAVLEAIDKAETVH
jgi:hypothetical protein